MSCAYMVLFVTLLLATTTNTYQVVKDKTVIHIVHLPFLLKH